MERVGKTPDFLLPVIALFGVLNGLLYCLLLPLWEGFDEPFHFAYVQTLSVRRELPVLGGSRLSQEVWQSLHLAPSSHVVRHNLPFVTTFGEFAALPEEARHARRESLRNLPLGLRETEAGNTLNYEAQQAPLAYLPLAAAEHLWRADPLVLRVLKLRLAGAVAACLLQFWLTLALARMLGLPAVAQALALFLVFACQMFYASVAHIGNDWLAIPLTTLVLIAALRLYRRPAWGSGAALGCTVGAGLLTKAYFLSWAVFAAGLAAWLVLRKRAWPAAAAMAAALGVLAVPWYARNILLYGSLSGMLQSASGLGTADVLRAALALPWPRAIEASARGAIWTGNNSFATFSSGTVDAVILLMLAAAGIWLWGSRRVAGRQAEWLTAAGCLCFFMALVYANALFYAFTKGGTYTATPWYPQALAAPVACLLCLGLSRAGLAGRLLGAALSLASAYLIGATYLVKLIPMYAGYGQGSVKLAPLLEWYRRDSSPWLGILRDTAPGDPRVILWLSACVALLGAAICAALWRRLWTGEGNPCRKP
jgi:hypothetical protein